MKDKQQKDSDLDSVVRQLSPKMRDSLIEESQSACKLTKLGIAEKREHQVKVKEFVPILLNRQIIISHNQTKVDYERLLRKNHRLSSNSKESIQDTVQKSFAKDIDRSMASQNNMLGQGSQSSEKLVFPGSESLNKHLNLEKQKYLMQEIQRKVEEKKKKGNSPTQRLKIKFQHNLYQ